MKRIVIGDSIVSYSQTNFLLSFLSFYLFIIAAFLRARARMPSMMTFIPSSIFLITFIMMISFSFSMLARIRSWSSSWPIVLDVSAIAISIFLPLISHQIINYCRLYIYSIRVPQNNQMNPYLWAQFRPLRIFIRINKVHFLWAV